MLSDELQMADVILKLGAVVGSSSHYSKSEVFSQLTGKFQWQLVGIAARMPHEDGRGGEDFSELREMMVLAADVAKSLLTARVRFCTFPMLDLLRSCARGTPAASLERRMSNTNRKDDARKASGARRIIKMVPLEMAQRFGDAYCHADVLDHLLHEGQLRLEDAARNANFVDPSNHVLQHVNTVLNSMALPLLFDGLRLRAGVQMATNLASRPDAFEGNFLAQHILTKQDTQMDAFRTRRAAAFFLAAARLGGVAYATPLPEVDRLQKAITEDLFECRYVSEQKCTVPSKVMRLVIGRFAEFVEIMQHSTGKEGLALRLALAVPCLWMSADLDVGPDTRSAYDGGMLSVWDAVRLLSTARAHQNKPAVPILVLLSMVLGGVVCSLVAPESESGPFFASTKVRKTVSEIEATWPESSVELPTEQSELRKRRQAKLDLEKTGRTERGKLIGASASVCMVMQGCSLKKARPRTEACEARYAASIGLMSAVFSVDRELQRCQLQEDPRPTDGIAPLKRLYVAQLGLEPYLVSYLRERPSMGNPLYEEDSSCVENTWRELMGGSILLFTMRKITEEAFRRTLREDWMKIERVQKVLERRKVDPNERIHGEGIMTSTAAMRLLGDRALESAEWVYDTKHIGQDVEGFKVARHALAQQFSLAKTAYRLACYGPLWECMITHFTTTHNFGKAGKRKRQPI